VFESQGTCHLLYLYFEARVEEETLKKVVLHSVATALASMVLPVLGGPNISTPCTRTCQSEFLVDKLAGYTSVELSIFQLQKPVFHTHSNNTHPFFVLRTEVGFTTASAQCAMSVYQQCLKPKP